MPFFEALCLENIFELPTPTKKKQSIQGAVGTGKPFTVS